MNKPMMIGLLAGCGMAIVGSYFLAQEQVAGKIAVLAKSETAPRGKVRRVRVAEEGIAGHQGGYTAHFEAIAPKPSASITAEAFTPLRREAEARRIRGKSHWLAGRFEEALQDFLWCFDEGMSEARQQAVRSSFLLRNIVQLSYSYPPAQDALRMRRDQAMARSNLEPANQRALGDFIAINRALGQEGVNLDFYDRLSADDPRKAIVPVYIFQELFAAQRYTEALRGRSYEQMMAQLDALFSPNDRRSDIERLSPSSPLYDGAVKIVLRNVEVLAGAGQLDRANELAGKLKTYDSSEDVRAQLQVILDRVDRMETLAPGRRKSN